MPKSLNLTNVALEEPLLPWFEADEVRMIIDVYACIVSFVLTKGASLSEWISDFVCDTSLAVYT